MQIRKLSASKFGPSRTARLGLLVLFGIFGVVGERRARSDAPYHRIWRGRTWGLGIVLIILFGVVGGLAEERLMTRMTLLGDDARCSFNDQSKWHPVSLPNGGKILVTQTAGEWVEYP